MNPEVVPTDLSGASAAVLDPMEARNCWMAGDLLHNHVTFLLFQLQEGTRFVLNVSDFMQKSWALY